MNGFSVGIVDNNYLVISDLKIKRIGHCFGVHFIADCRNIKF